MLVLVYEDFHRDNDATLRTVMQFLGVDDGAPIDTTSVNVTTRTVRSWRAKHLLRSLRSGESPLARSTKATIKTLTTRRLRRRVNRTVRERIVTAAPPPPDESVMLELRRRYKPEVVALSEYLDRDLVSLWGYEQID